MPQLRPGDQHRPAPTRFAFYGYTCTGPLVETPGRDQQFCDLTRAQTLTEQLGGQIITQYYDIDSDHRLHPRLRPWTQRPQARLMLDALPSHEFDALIVANITPWLFAGDDVWDVVALLARHGMTLWTPGIHRPLDPTNPEHALMASIYTGTAGEGNGPTSRPDADGSSAGGRS
ncbi:hypothetical protein [Actinomadura parmotrematis]|uniref:Recombinase family protein n=1 Tax=Actinomadura parmotrematis TaxID=2864039 RepID=A0ABS7G6M3_9ACTN|nr:hypothetical protein [Actinomadura parmotrematis]MBW8487283.1 hypothetical protein [Actinomadura parmotrematis]